jgi:hypothetical protein
VQRIGLYGHPLFKAVIFEAFFSGTKPAAVVEVTRELYKPIPTSVIALVATAVRLIY